MNHPLNDPKHSWMRLAAAARTVRDDRESSAPYGFATRVAALAFAQEARMASLAERFAFRALGVASLLAVFSIAMNYDVLSTPVAASAPVAAMTDDTADLVPIDDAVAIVLDIAD